MNAIDAIEVGHHYDLQVLWCHRNGMKVRFGDQGCGDYEKRRESNEEAARVKNVLKALRIHDKS